MKIIDQTESAMTLTEGNMKSVIAGIIMIIVGAGILLGGVIQNLIVTIILAALIVIGLGTILFSSSIKINIDKGSGQLSYRKARLIGTKTTTYLIADIFRIETRCYWKTGRVSEGQGRSAVREVFVSQSFIIFKDGRELPLDHQKQQNMLTGIFAGKNESALASSVAQFLSVPFEEIKPPSSGIGFNAGSPTINI